MSAVKVIVLSFGITTLVAQAAIKPIGNGKTWLIGIAIDTESLPYQQTKALTTSLQPYIAYEWENLHIGVDDIAYNFFSTSSISITAVLQPRWSPINEDSPSIFNDLERHDAIEAGVLFDYKLSKNLVSQWYWQSHFFQDVSNVYKDTHASTQLGFQREYSDYELDISLGVKYQSAGLNQYLYGVNSNEATNSRQAFYTDSSFQPFIEFSVQYELSNQSFLITQFNFLTLDQTLKNSSLIDNTTQANLLLGWITAF